MQGMKPDEIAATFRSARLAAQSLASYPGEIVPANLALAYQVQEIAISAWPDRIAGWKVALIQPAWRENYPAERLAGPIFSRNVWDATRSAEVEVPIIENGYAAVEAEFAIRIARSLPASATFTDPEQLLPYIEGVYAAVEIAASPLATLSVLGPGAVASDFGNNGGLVVGPKLPDIILTDPSQSSSATEINQRPCGQGDATRVPGGPLRALLFLVEHLGSRGRTLCAGDLISTGATTGIHAVKAGDRVKASFSGDVSISMKLSKARAY
jgi:2-keto-4-pentenoate hydratase